MKQRMQVFSRQQSWDGQVVSASVNSLRFFSGLKEELRTQPLIIEHRLMFPLNEQLKSSRKYQLSASQQSCYKSP